MELVANAELGRFPCKDPVETWTRWTAQQQADTKQVMQHFDGLRVSVLAPKRPSKEKIRSQESF